MKSILILVLAFLYANISRGRRIEADDYYGDYDSYNDDRDDVIDDLITNDVEAKEFHDNEENQRENQEKKVI